MAPKAMPLAFGSLYIPPKDEEIALQTPRTRVLAVCLIGYSTNHAAKMNLLTLLVEIS